MPSVPTQPQMQYGRIPLYPTPNRDVIHSDTSLHHHFFQIAVAERVPQIPSDAQDYDDVLEVAPSEQRRLLLAHRFNLPNPVSHNCNRAASRNLDGDRSIQASVARLPNFSHAAGANRRDDFVRPQFGAR